MGGVEMKVIANSQQLTACALGARGLELTMKTRRLRLEARSYFNFSKRLRISAAVLESLESVANSRYLE